MAGHVDFGDDGDVAVGRIAHDIADFVLSVVTAVADAVVDRRVMAQHGAVAPRTHFGQPRIFLYFHAPALIIGQVPVQAVHAVEGHDVDVALHRFHAKEMAHAIQVHPAIGETRIGGYLGRRQQDLACQSRRQ